MNEPLADLDARVAAALAGVAAGAVAAGEPDPSVDLLSVSEAAGAAGGFDASSFRDIHRAAAEPLAPAVLALRGLIFGLQTPLDRPRLRRSAYQAVAVASNDEAARIAAIAIAIVTADLVRGFSLDEVLPRARQSLLEEAPLALLEALAPAVTDDRSPASTDGSDPFAVIQAAVTAMHGETGREAVLEKLRGSGGAALVLAGAWSWLIDFRPI